MKSEHRDYLAAINLTNTLSERIEELFSLAQVLCPDEITGLYVTEYIQEDGTREYESAYFFSSKFVLEAKKFATEDIVDISFYKDKIHYLELRKQDYAINNATDRSRVYLSAHVGGLTDLRFDLKGSKENCDYLMQIFNDYLKPNLPNGT